MVRRISIVSDKEFRHHSHGPEDLILWCSTSSFLLVRVPQKVPPLKTVNISRPRESSTRKTSSFKLLRPSKIRDLV